MKHRIGGCGERVIVFPRFHRQSIRLKDYDYRQSGAYFVTICAHERLHLFGRVIDGEMVLSEIGKVVQACWDAIPDHFPHVDLDAFVVMPNHLHGILVISEPLTGDVGAQYIAPQYIAPLPKPPQSMVHPQTDATKRGVTPNNVTQGSLGSMIRSFKAGVTRTVRWKVEGQIWQRNYHDHIIRNPLELARIREYVALNPARWTEDSLFSE